MVRSLQTHRGHECDGSFGLLMISLNNSFFQGGTIGQHTSLIPLKKKNWVQKSEFSLIHMGSEVHIQLSQYFIKCSLAP